MCALKYITQIPQHRMLQTHDVPVTFYLFMNYGITHTLEGRKENLPSFAVLTGGVQVLFSENRVKGKESGTCDR